MGSLQSHEQEAIDLLKNLLSKLFKQEQLSSKTKLVPFMRKARTLLEEEEEEDKHTEEAEVEEDFFLHTTKEEVMTTMMEVKHLINPKFSVFIVKDLAIMKEIVGKNKNKKLIFLKKKKRLALYSWLLIQLIMFPKRCGLWIVVATIT